MDDELEELVFKHKEGEINEEEGRLLCELQMERTMLLQ